MPDPIPASSHVGTKLAYAKLPSAFSWLKKLDCPRLIDEALLRYGIKEVPGAKNAPEIMAWADELNLGYEADLIPWCGLFVAICVSRAGWEVVKNPLWARNWALFGNPSPEPGLGDILVFKRDSGGHVAFYIGEDASAYYCLGGNQGDSVSIVRIAKARLIAARRPKWHIAQPASVKPYHLYASGELSRNEA